MGIEPAQLVRHLIEKIVGAVDVRVSEAPAHAGAQRSNVTIPSLPSAPSSMRASAKTVTRTLNGTSRPPPTKMARKPLVIRVGNTSFTFGRDTLAARPASVKGPTRPRPNGASAAPHCREGVFHPGSSRSHLPRGGSGSKGASARRWRAWRGSAGIVRAPSHHRSVT
jgi:hypothetical protein